MSDDAMSPDEHNARVVRDFVKDMPDYFGDCLCGQTPEMQTAHYILAQEVGMALSNWMRHNNICPKGAPPILAMAVGHLFVEYAAHLSGDLTSNPDPETAGEYATLWGEFSKRSGMLVSRAMRVSGCSRS